MSSFCDIRKIIISEHLTNNESEILNYFFPSSRIKDSPNSSQYYLKHENKINLMLKFDGIELWNIHKITLHEGSRIRHMDITQMKKLFQIRFIKKSDLAEILSNLSWIVALINTEGIYFRPPVLMKEIIKSLIDQKNDNIDIIANAI